ncbi:MAG TPA: thioredoxin [Bacteroidia bacterium]|nr:thioredoxin [Bacteroidia bacterium]
MKEKFQDIISADKPTLVDFYADWCGPCKIMAPMLEEYATLNSSKVRVLKINVDHNQKISQYYNIQSIPTLILYKNAKVLWRKSGLLSLSDLKSATDQLIDG